LKERWLELTDDKKVIFREWTEWDKKRHAHELAIFQSRRAEDEDAIEGAAEDDMQAIHIPKKRKQIGDSCHSTIPKKQK
jgi:hypothetical protein